MQSILMRTTDWQSVLRQLNASDNFGLTNEEITILSNYLSSDTDIGYMGENMNSFLRIARPVVKSYMMGKNRLKKLELRCEP